MAPKVTSSSNRSKRSTSKPVTGAKPSGRANRQSTSTARVTQSGGGRGGSARVTNASQRTSGSARVTGSARPALPPGRRGGAMVRQETKPENPRRTSARSRQNTASRGTTGPNRVGQPAGSANRMFGANVVNRSVNRAVTQSTLRGALNRGTAPTAIAGALLNTPAEIKKLQALLKDPGGTIRRASNEFLSGNAAKSVLGKEKNYTQGSAKAGPQPPKRKPPKPPAASTTTRTSSRSSSASAPARTPSRSSAPARSSASRPASRPAATTPKGPSAPPPPKMPTAQSNFGPVKSGEEYGKMIGAPKPSKTESSAPKKKSSALSQAEIRKRRLNR
jgi:hypothetical protein